VLTGEVFANDAEIADESLEAFLAKGYAKKVEKDEAPKRDDSVPQKQKVHKRNPRSDRRKARAERAEAETGAEKG
jgi:hypothetical protein